MDKYDRKILIALGVVAFFLAFGTLFYHAIENWSFLDSFYMAGVTLTTVGYGDLTPTHTLSKLFSVFLAFMGIGIIFYCVGLVSRRYFEQQERTIDDVWRNHGHHVSRLKRGVAKNVGTFAERVKNKNFGRKTEFVPIDHHLKKRK